MSRRSTAPPARVSAAPSLATTLGALGAQVDGTLDQVSLPMTLIDASRRIRWQNQASVALIGERRGSSYLDALAPEYQRQSLERFTAFMFGADIPSDNELTVLQADGSPARAAVTTLPIRATANDRVVAVLTIVRHSAALHPRELAPPDLAPRLRQTLQLLASGSSTPEIAEALGVTTETARNYVRRLLQALGVHSRIEAVARGRETDLI